MIVIARQLIGCAIVSLLVTTNMPTAHAAQSGALAAEPYTIQYPSNWITLNRTSNSVESKSGLGYQVMVRYQAHDGACANAHDAAVKAEWMALPSPDSVRVKRDWLARAKAAATSLFLPDGSVVTLATVCGEGHAVTIEAKFPATNDDQLAAQVLTEYKQVVESVRFAPAYNPAATSDLPIVGTWSDPGEVGSWRSMLVFKPDGTVLSTFEAGGIRQEGIYTLQGNQLSIRWTSLKGVQPGKVPQAEVCSVNIEARRLVIAGCSEAGIHHRR